MKQIVIFLFFSCFYSFVLAQDSININFVKLKDNNNSKIIHFVNGKYSIPSFPILKSKNSLKTFYLVSPISLIDEDSLLSISSFRDLFLNDKFYEVLNKEGISSCGREIYSFQIFDENGHYKKRVSELEPIDTTNKTDFLNYKKVEISAKKHRDSIQPFVNKLLQPYFISRYEITNLEYRNFVNWVKDSIALKLLYDSLPKEKALKLLNVSKKELRNLDSNLMRENLIKYGFNYNLKPLENIEISAGNENLKILEFLYYPQPERFYRRREIDAKKIIYRTEKYGDLYIYPDTLSFKYLFEDTSIYYTDPLFSMYFWHPGYNNYPVMGLNFDQMKAYCYWFERQINAENRDLSIEFKVEIPSIYHYEMSLKNCLPIFKRGEVETNPIINYSYKRTDESTRNHISSVSESFESYTNKYSFDLLNWQKSHTTDPIYNLINGLAEICSNDIEKDILGNQFVQVLGSDLRTIAITSNDNQFNSLFYKREFEKDKVLPFVGFRPIVYFYKR